MSSIHGTYLVQKDMSFVRLNNKIDKTHQILNYFDFEKLLHRYFEADITKKLLDKLNDNEKLLIDFDKGIVNLIKTKEMPFVKTLTTFFKPMFIQQQIDSGYFDVAEDILYKKENFDA